MTDRPPLDRYLGLLLDKLEAQHDLDEALCDRIERVLRIAPPRVGRAQPAAPERAAERRTPEIADIIAIVSRRFNVDPAAMVGPGRAQPETGARQLAMRLARELTGKSYPEIGRAFNRDHATVIHACEVTEGMAVGDIREELETLVFAGAEKDNET